MDHDHPGHEHSPEPRAFNLVLIAFIGIAAFYLFTEHRAHLYGFLPYALLLACPLMHLFMHHGHGHGGHTHETPETRRDALSQGRPEKKEGAP